MQKWRIFFVVCKSIDINYFSKRANLLYKGSSLFFYSGTRNLFAFCRLTYFSGTALYGFQRKFIMSVGGNVHLSDNSSSRYLLRSYHMLSMVLGFEIREIGQKLFLWEICSLMDKTVNWFFQSFWRLLNLAMTTKKHTNFIQPVNPLPEIWLNKIIFLFLHLI